MRIFTIKSLTNGNIIEGVEFSDGKIVIHGGVFNRVYIDSREDMEMIFKEDTSEIEWKVVIKPGRVDNGPSSSA